MENKALLLFRDIGIIAFLLLFPHFFPLPFYLYSVVCLFLIWFFLRKEAKTFHDLGLSKNGLTMKAVLIGVVSALLWVGFMQLIYIPTIKYLFVVPDYTEYNFIRSSFVTLLAVVAASWFIGGFYEEIIFRGYIQSILEIKVFKKYDIFWSVISTSILSGLYHWQQDVFDTITLILIYTDKFGNLY